jgi:hypothetical protein
MHGRSTSSHSLGTTPRNASTHPATAIATSGRDQRQWQRADGSIAHHIIDPRTGAPAHSDVVRAGVIAPTLVTADVTARTLVILGYQAGFAWLALHPEYAALLHLQRWTNGHITDLAYTSMDGSELPLNNGFRGSSIVSLDLRGLCDCR